MGRISVGKAWACLRRKRKGTVGMRSFAPLTNIIQFPTLPLKLAAVRDKQQSASPCMKATPNKVIPDVNVFCGRVVLVVPAERDR